MSLRYLLPAFALAAFAVGPVASAQPLVISEVDADTPGSTDSAEFVEIYNASSSSVDLEDYVLVLFNGSTSDDLSYGAYDLDDVTLAAGEFYVLCGDDTAVQNCDQEVSPQTGFIENGADAVALYAGDASDYGTGTEPTRANLVDAVVYGTGDAADDDLLDALGESTQYDEDENDRSATESLQRLPAPDSGGFEALAPTPGERPVPTPMDIDDARALGDGAAVVVQGVVTRTEGEYLFFEDETGGLALLLEGGPFANEIRQAVEDGDIEPGTVLNVTGVLSSEFGFLQIEDSDIVRYVIVDTADVPDPQVVTLAQLAANGEAYESELVSIEDVTIDGEGTFTANQIYDLDDDSTPSNSVVLRVPDEENTRVEGTDIPAGEVLLTGVVGQFSLTGINIGYQLLLIDPADVDGNATEGDGGDDGGTESDAPLLISEVDPNQLSTDRAEFVEIVNTGDEAIDLDDFVLVLFNGSDDRSYRTIGLPGFVLEPDAFFVLCGNDEEVENCDLEVSPQTELIQNGPDAVALYEAVAADFPDGTGLTRSGLVDAIVYGNDDDDDTGLLGGLGQSVQYDENENDRVGTESIQRSPADAQTFIVAEPTPGLNPDGSEGGGDGEGELVTIAEARTAGAESTVTVQGVVTRSQGAFTYLQDETGGLTIRQTSGAFADLVAEGDIEPGTVVEVTGELSAFNGLLQINGDDLTDFEVVGTADVPAPQLVTLEELATNGEAYEGELVAVTVATIDAEAGTPFAPGTTYNISDRTDASNTVTLRVPSAADTDVDGELIPEAAVTLVGVVGQFDNDGDDDEEGYQILVIDAADVNPEGVASEDGPEGALTLTVANPIRGSVSVSFGVETPGAARVVLYDALGRQVRVLADGDVPAGLHSARLDASAFAAGVYVLRLETEAGARSRTVTIVR